MSNQDDKYRQAGWIVEDRSRNGVVVKVYRKNRSSVVMADCQCYGILGRVHSNDGCQLLQRLDQNRL